MPWRGWRRRELRRRKSHKNTLYKIYVREWLRTHTNTHTHETEEISRCRVIKKIKCPEPNHLDEVPGSD